MAQSNEKIKILIVEDDEVDRTAARRAIHHLANVEILEVEDSRSAIAILEKDHNIECVFLDYCLPDGDGLQLIQQLRAAEIQVPLVVLTGQGDEQIAARLIQAGASDYLSKENLSPENLSRSLYQALRVHLAEQEAAQANQQLRESEERYRLVVEGSNEGIWDWYVDSKKLYCNNRLREIVGLSNNEVELNKDMLGELLHPEDFERVRQAIKNHIDKHEELAVEFRVRHTSGEYRHCIARGKAQRDRNGRPWRVCGVVTDITERKRAEERSRFLSEASKLLSGSLDRQATLENLAQLAVPWVADWSAIELFESERSPRRISVAHVDPSKRDLVWELQSRNPSRMGESDACFKASPQQLEAMAQSEKHLELLQQLNVHSYICVPLQLEERTLGSLLFVKSDSARRYTQADLTCAEDLAYRVTLATENARLYQESQQTSNHLRQAVGILGEQQQQLRTLGQLTNLLNQRLSDLHQLLQAMAEAVCEAITRAQTCFIALYDGSGKQATPDSYPNLIVIAGREVENWHWQEALSQESLLAQVFLTGEPQLIKGDSVASQNQPAASYAVAIKSAQSGRLGILGIGNWEDRNSFDTEDQSLLKAVGEQAAIAIDNAQLIQTLEEREVHLGQQNQQLAGQNAELEKQQQQIRLQNLKLLEASRLKSQFLATMSHELRTPMNAIMGFSQLLQRQVSSLLTPQQGQMLDRIIGNGKTLLFLINDILDLSKMEVGELQLQPKSFHLLDLVGKTVEELRSLAEEKNLALEWDSGLENPYVYNDSDRTRQILVNFLSNAIKFTNTGSVTVGIRELSPDRIELTVADTGIGMSEKQQTQIFEEFRQADQTTTRKYSGTGLGLAITESLVHLMQGKISVESQLGKGSTFRVELPRQVSESPPLNGTSPSNSNSSSRISKNKKRHLD
jgi:PAS domain S-box-containing protein